MRLSCHVLPNFLLLLGSFSIPSSLKSHLLLSQSLAHLARPHPGPCGMTPGTARPADCRAHDVGSGRPPPREPVGLLGIPAHNGDSMTCYKLAVCDATADSAAGAGKQNLFFMAQ